MSLRFEDIARIGIVSAFVLVGCSGDDPAAPSGTAGGTGSSGSAGMSTGGTLTTNAGSSAGGAGSSAGGTASAGTATGGSATGGGSAGTAAGGTAGTSAGSGGGGGAGGAGSKSKTTFFVTSDTSMTGKLGGLAGADKRCQDLAAKAGFGDRTFHAYLSTATVNAKDRIGAGPWVNALGTIVAADLTALHAAKGNIDIFGVDENKMKINGQWNSSADNQHDILTGSMPDGTVQAGKTCMDWTSDSDQANAQIGHCDGMGPGMATTGTYTSWNSSHENGPGGCADTKPKGGAGRLYCFAID
jgi:hypothetical protein